MVKEDVSKTFRVKASVTGATENPEALTSGAAPLTASIHAAPESHNAGRTQFTFELQFSEEFKLSYLVVRDSRPSR